MTPWDLALQEVWDAPRTPLPDFAGWLLHDAPAFPELAVGGRVAVPMQGERTRFMPEEDLPYQGGEAAKAYLRQLMRAHRPPRQFGMPFARQQRDLGLLIVSPPMLVPEESTAGMWWVDLRRAYFEIYRPLTLDLHFSPATGRIRLGHIPFEAAEGLAGMSDARDAVIGHVRRTSSTVMRFGHLTQENRVGFWLQPHLWAVIQFTLHAVACDMLRLGAVSVLTDGYCFRTGAEGKLAIDYLAHTWQLAARFKGHADVKRRPTRNVLDLDRDQIEGLRKSRSWALGK